jgi:hypothetical protein
VRKFLDIETGKGADALDRRLQLAAALAEAPLLDQQRHHYHDAHTPELFCELRALHSRYFSGRQFAQG